MSYADSVNPSVGLSKQYHVARARKTAVRTMAVASVALILSVQAAGGATTTVTVQIPGTVKTEQSHGPTDGILTVAQVAGALAALGGLVFLGFQLKEANKSTAALTGASNAANVQNRQDQADAKVQRTVAFQDRFTGPEFALVHARVQAYFDVDDARDAVEKIHAWVAAPHAGAECLPRTPRDTSAPMASKIDLQTVLSFYENMGAAHRLGQLDEDAFRLTFGPRPVDIFAQAWWYICWRRGGRTRRADQETVFSEFDDLVRWTVDREPSLRQECTPNPSVRLLVLPAVKYADSVAWHLCGRLSAALSANIEQLPSGLDASLGSSTRGSMVSRIIAVPANLDPDMCGWVKGVRTAKKLEERLGAMNRSELEEMLRELPEPSA